ncbi:MAG: exodeoxyribonuclease VII small subunit [Anaerovoracaceae bacterium]
MSKEPTFEEALNKLSASTEKLNEPNLPLEEAMKSYEEGLAYYEQCSHILQNAKQKIETYKK